MIIFMDRNLMIVYRIVSRRFALPYRRFLEADQWFDDAVGFVLHH